jgi:hypothetical protein
MLGFIAASIGRNYYNIRPWRIDYTTPAGAIDARSWNLD